MTATLARSAAPPYALRVWTDATSVYTEIPGKPGGLPHVMSFALSEGGLSKALSILRRRADPHHGRSDFALDTLPTPGYICPSLTGFTGRGATKGTEVQRAHALAVLKRMRII